MLTFHPIGRGAPCGGEGRLRRGSVDRLRRPVCALRATPWQAITVDDWGVGPVFVPLRGGAPCLRLASGEGSWDCWTGLTGFTGLGLAGSRARLRAAARRCAVSSLGFGRGKLGLLDRINRIYRIGIGGEQGPSSCRCAELRRGLRWASRRDALGGEAGSTGWTIFGFAAAWLAGGVL